MVARSRSMVRAARRRPQRLLGALTAALVLLGATGCSVRAGSAVVVGGTSVPESSVQHDTAAFSAQNLTTPATQAQTALFNRAQITFAVRHALMAKAISAQGITVTEAQVNATRTRLTAQNEKAAAALGLPSDDEQDVVHDLVAIDAMIRKLPASGAPVTNVTVTAEGVPATTRDQAVAKRAEYLAHPARMDTDAAAAGQNGVPKGQYDLLRTVSAGALGLYQLSAGQVVIVPGTQGYLVLRSASRTVSRAALTAAAFTTPDPSTGAAPGIATVFDLAALLLVPYESGTPISVNPRYGVWDPVSVQVVPGNDGL